MFQTTPREAIILAGGLGTRLRGVIGELPKCMAPVNGQPFLHYLLCYLEQQHLGHVVLSLGYKSEMIIDWIRENPPVFQVDFVIEEEPLGTGGGILLALEKCGHEDVFVLNGDTLFDVRLEQMMRFHKNKEAATSIALKNMDDAVRYGTVQLKPEGLITAFEEKAATKNSPINGGIYLLNRKSFLERKLPAAFSFEKEYLQQFVDEGEFYGFMSDAYFIDIGVPEDYSRAQTDFQSLFPA